MASPDEASVSALGGPVGGHLSAEVGQAPAEQEVFGILGPVLVGIVMLWILIAALAGQSI